MYIDDFKIFLIKENCPDLLFILCEIHEKNIMKFSYFLKQISCGFGVVVSEETGFGLEENYDNPEELDEIIFFIGGYESSTISKKKFCDILKGLSDIYILYSPKEKEIIYKYINDIFKRYNF